jgi:hypothetical protein
MDLRLHEANLVILLSIYHCTYAALHNYYPVILRVYSQLVAEWSEYEVMKCWEHLYSLTAIVP